MSVMEEHQITGGNGRNPSGQEAWIWGGFCRGIRFGSGQLIAIGSSSTLICWAKTASKNRGHSPGITFSGYNPCDLFNPSSYSPKLTLSIIPKSRVTTWEGLVILWAFKV
jgi:hypothetical protein